MQDPKLLAASPFIALFACFVCASACASGEGEDAEAPAPLAPAIDAGNGVVLPPRNEKEPPTDAAGAGLQDSAPSKPDALDAAPHACTSTMALLGGGASGMFTTTWTSGSWAAPQPLAGSIASTPALVGDGTGYLGVARSSSDALLYTRTTSATAPWSSPSPIGSATSQGAPALVGTGASAHLVYWGMNSKFYHGTFTAGAWDGASDPVGPPNSQSYGPSAPAAAAFGSAGFTTVQSGADSKVYLRGWSTSWTDAAPLSGGFNPKLDASPRIVTLSGGGTLVVFSHSDDLLMYAVRWPGGGWQPASALHNDVGTTPASSPSSVALAALATGGAVLVYMGADGKAYYSLFPASAPATTPSSSSPWSAPLPLPSAATIAMRPELATGVCGADAVAAWATSTGSVEVMSLHGSAWSAPSSIAGASNATYVTIATQP